MIIRKTGNSIDNTSQLCSQNHRVQLWTASILVSLSKVISRFTHNYLSQQCISQGKAFTAVVLLSGVSQADASQTARNLISKGERDVFLELTAWSVLLFACAYIVARLNAPTQNDVPNGRRQIDPIIHPRSIT